MPVFNSELNLEENGAKKVPKVGSGFRPNVTKKLANSLFFLYIFGDFHKLLRSQRVNKQYVKNFFQPKWPKWPITPIYFTIWQKLGVNEFTMCLSNTLTAEHEYIRYFGKILSFLQKWQFSPFSLHLYAKWMCAFYSALNFKDTGPKKVL